MNNNYNRPDDNFGDYRANDPEIFSDGVDRAVLLMHVLGSEYRRDIHDLENPLTAQGRDLASRFGARLPDVDLRGYSSPVKRCTDTAYNRPGSAAASRGRSGWRGARYYCWRVLCAGSIHACGRDCERRAVLPTTWVLGLPVRFLRRPLMRPQRAVSMVLEVMLDKLKAPAVSEGRQLDLCVTHDMTIFYHAARIGLRAGGRRRR